MYAGNTRTDHAQLPFGRTGLYTIYSRDIVCHAGIKAARTNARRAITGLRCRIGKDVVALRDGGGSRPLVFPDFGKQALHLSAQAHKTRLGKAFKSARLAGTGTKSQALRAVISPRG